MLQLIKTAILKVVARARTFLRTLKNHYPFQVKMEGRTNQLKGHFIQADMTQMIVKKNVRFPAVVLRMSPLTRGSKTEEQKRNQNLAK